MSKMLEVLLTFTLKLIDRYFFTLFLSFFYTKNTYISRNIYKQKKTGKES